MLQTLARAVNDDPAVLQVATSSMFFAFASHHDVDEQLFDVIRNHASATAVKWLEDRGVFRFPDPYPQVPAATWPRDLAERLFERPLAFVLRLPSRRARYPLPTDVAVGGHAYRTQAALKLLTAPPPLVARLTAAITSAIRTIAAEDVVAVGLVYSGFDPDDTAPSDIDVCACTRQRREEILAEQPPPDGLPYIWSNLEFDAHASTEDYERHLAPVWAEVYAYAQLCKTEIARRPDELDDTWVPRSVRVAACRRLNAGGWQPERPKQLAEDAIIYPAARSGVDPDTPDNLRAVLSEEQRHRLDAARLLPF